MKVKKKDKEVNTYNLKVPPNSIAFLNIKKLQSLKSFSQTYTKKGNFNLQLTARNNFIKSYYRIVNNENSKEKNPIVERKKFINCKHFKRTC